MSEAYTPGTSGPSNGHGIVVGVDGSDQSLCALVWAAKEAERRRTPLYVVTAYTVPVFAASSMDAGYATVDDSVVREGAQAVLDQAVSRIAGHNIEVIPRVETGDASGVLLELSEEAELMVVGSRGRGGFVGRLLGSVSAALPAHSKCPTVVVPLYCAPRLDEAGVEPPKPKGAPCPRAEEIEKVVVVGVDGSEQARMASLVAAEQAQTRGLPLRVVCSLPPFTGSLAWMPAPVDREALHSEIMVQLNAGKAWLQSHFPEVDITVELLDGPPVETLIEASRTAELVVVGTRGRGGFAGMLLGSTSQGVLHHAKGPVLVVPDREDTRLKDRESFGPMVGPTG
ncbi:nucleotide-binding universal stress UspA family protein [Arthrobacter pigmenti]|uniref:Nucleotide-binding universal stress UspA family protein n=1 Tax=Arthrobacter pigmenti TaxID=271432 RepID=A0A846RZS3_9MICC|nr:universal stress protein [Arthrobacter pigmenti]NJC24446.1 nucleotide-binding universal stress UspA family protein [Arthrobacter pigmenti]